MAVLSKEQVEWSWFEYSGRVQCECGNIVYLSADMWKEYADPDKQKHVATITCRECGKRYQLRVQVEEIE